MKENWTNEIQARLKNHQEQAPEGLLDDVKREMMRRNVTPYLSKKRKAARVTMWSSRVAAAVAIVVIGFFLWTQLDVTETEGTSAQMAQSKEELQSKEVQSVQVARRMAASYRKVAASNSSRQQHNAALDSKMDSKMGSKLGSKKNPKLDSKKNSTDELLANTTVPTSESANNKEVADGNHASQGTVDEKQVSQGTSVANRYHRSDDYQLARQNHRRSVASPVDVGFFYGGMGTAFSDASNQGILLASADPIGSYDGDMASENTTQLMQGTDGVQIRSKHHQPVKFGLSLRYQLNDRWSIQTGLTYSYLSSDFTYESNHRYVGKSQSLHYMGIPVTASYSIWRGKHYQVYTLAGMEIEKLVSGKVTTSSPENSSKLDNDIKESRPQFSVNASVGAEYKFTNMFSAYLEPGINYYIKNGSTVDNIYKDKPLNFNLNIGLRINVNK